MKRTIRLATVTLMSTLMLAGCGRNLGGNTYTSSNTSGKVVYGRIVSAKPITIKDSDRVQDNVLGGAAGGIAGGVAGSTVGNGKGQSLATIAGALAGATLGAYAQDQLSTSTGYQYVVKLDGNTKVKTTKQKKSLQIKRGSDVDEDINDSVEVDTMSTSTISVIQQDDAMLPRGSRVMVIYSGDRPRVELAD